MKNLHFIQNLLSKNPLLLVVCFVFLVFNSNAQSAKCPADDPTVFCGPTVTEKTLVTTPEFPDCQILVEYTYRYCNGNVQVIDNKFLDYSDPDCEEWLNYIIGLFFNNPVKFDAYFRKLNIAVADQCLSDIINGIYNDASDPSEYYCGQSGGTLVSADFYFGNCVTTCFGRKADGRGVYKQIKCDGDICCSLSREYCLDPNTNQPILLSSVLQKEKDGGTCGKPIIKNCPEIEGVTWIGIKPCGALCAAPTFSKESDINDYEPIVPLRFSINANSETFTAKIFPNPTSNYLNICFQKNFSGRVSVFSIDGKSLLSKEFTDSSVVHFDVSSLATGSYLVNFTDLQGIQSNQKIIIN